MLAESSGMGDSVSKKETRPSSEDVLQIEESAGVDIEQSPENPNARGKGREEGALNLGTPPISMACPAEGLVKEGEQLEERSGGGSGCETQGPAEADLQRGAEWLREVTGKGGESAASEDRNLDGGGRTGPSVESPGSPSRGAVQIGSERQMESVSEEAPRREEANEGGAGAPLENAPGSAGYRPRFGTQGGYEHRVAETLAKQTLEAGVAAAFENAPGSAGYRSWSGMQGQQLREPWQKEGDLEADEDASDGALENAPGSAGYLPRFKRGRSFNQQGSSVSEGKAVAAQETAEPATREGRVLLGGDLLLDFCQGLGTVAGKGTEMRMEGGVALTSTEQDQGAGNGKATWQQELLDFHLGGGESEEDRGAELRTGSLVRKSEGLGQDLNQKSGETEQAPEAVTKKLQAQMAALEEEAATRFGETMSPRTVSAQTAKKESHAETMRKLKAELAALERRAAAQNLLKRRSGFAEVRGKPQGFAELREQGLQRGSGGRRAEEARRARAESRKASKGGEDKEAQNREGVELKKRRRPNGLYRCQVGGVFYPELIGEGVFPWGKRCYTQKKSVHAETEVRRHSQWAPVRSAGLH